LRLGLTGEMVDRRIELGRLRPLHRGVYAVGQGRLSPKAACFAGVLAGGEGAVLSHGSAAAVHGLLSSVPAVVHLTSPRRMHRRPGLAFHRAVIPSDEVDVIDCIPVTGVSRTILDLAATAGQDVVDRALHAAEVRRLSDRVSLTTLLSRYPHRRGAPAVRIALANRRIGATTVRSDLEDAFAAFVAARGLPRPEINANVRAGDRWYEVDCAWRSERVAVELDGRSVHHTIRAFEEDRRRDRALQVHGWTVVRVTARHLDLDADGLHADLASLLRARPTRRVRT
jgi:very-short-patch-repair endonuclease